MSYPQSIFSIGICFEFIFLENKCGDNDLVVVNVGYGGNSFINLNEWLVFRRLFAFGLDGKFMKNFNEFGNDGKFDPGII